MLNLQVVSLGLVFSPGMLSCIILSLSFFYYILPIFTLTITHASQLFCRSFFGACKDNSISSKWLSLPHPDHHFKVLVRSCISISSRHLLPHLLLAPYFYLWFVSSIPDPVLSQFKWTFLTKTSQRNIPNPSQPIYHFPFISSLHNATHKQIKMMVP